MFSLHKKPSFSLREALHSLEVALKVDKKIKRYEKNILSLR